jgi:hypothetical protein
MGTLSWHFGVLRRANETDVLPTQAMMPGPNSIRARLATADRSAVVETLTRLRKSADDHPNPARMTAMPPCAASDGVGHSALASERVRPCVASDRPPPFPVTDRMPPFLATDRAHPFLAGWDALQDLHVVGVDVGCGTGQPALRLLFVDQELREPRSHASPTLITYAVDRNVRRRSRVLDILAKAGRKISDLRKSWMIYVAENSGGESLIVGTKTLP